MSIVASTLAVCVARKAMEARDICSFELVATESGSLPAFSAGSHVDVHLLGGLVRQYSLCNDPSETHRYAIAVLRDPNSRGGSIAMHDAVKEGDTLTISAPKNHFALAHKAKRSVLLAGGIGITPILCMAERLATLGDEFTLHYTARARDRMAFFDRLRRSSFADKVALHFDDEAAEQRLDINAVLASADTGTHLYVCGPKGFMDAVLNAARAHGWPEDRLHWEFFAADVTARASDRPFEVQIASSGHVIDVPVDKTVVQALLQAGVDIMVSCEQGVCGTCVTRVLRGEVDHRDTYFTPEEQARNDQFTPCCSRAKSPRLVLDL